VDGSQLQGQQLLRLIEVVEIGARILPVDGAGAVGVDGREVRGPFGVAHIQGALAGEEHGVAAIAAGHHAVELIDAEGDGLEDVLGGTDTHEVAGAVGGEDAVDELYHLVHHLGRFAHGQAANGIALGILGGDVLGALRAQVAVGATLHDGVEGLVVAVAGLCLAEALHAAIEPVMGEGEALAGIVVGRRAWGTFVEGHDDICADGALDVDDAFGGEEMLRAVDMAAELAAFLAQLTNAREREYLEAAAVGEHGALEAVELVQAAGSLKHAGAGAQVEVVGVTQNDLGVDVLVEVAQLHALHGAHSAHGHEDGCVNVAVVGVNDTGAGGGVGIGMLESEEQGLFSV